MLSLITPSWSPINALSILIGDPGEYWACSDLSNKGLFIVSLSKPWKLAVLSWPINWLEWYVGALTNVSISPEDGSIATIPPLLLFSKLSAYSCSLISIVKVRLSAFFGDISLFESLYFEFQFSHLNPNASFLKRGQYFLDLLVFYIMCLQN